MIILTEFFFQETNKNNFLVLISYSIITLISIKVLAEIFIINLKIKIQNNLIIFFQKNLLKKFLNENWKFHLKNDSSKLIRQLTYELGNIVSRIIIPLIEIIIDICLAISFLILLILYNYKIAIIVFSLIIFSLAMLNYFSRKQIKKISKKRYLVSLFSFKIITEIFVILKDLIISGSASSKIEKYIASIKNTTRMKD